MTEITTEQTMAVLNTMAQLWTQSEREEYVQALADIPKMSKREASKLTEAILTAPVAAGSAYD